MITYDVANSQVLLECDMPKCVARRVERLERITQPWKVKL